jgi:signal transduction histidine kinase
MYVVALVLTLAIIAARFGLNHVLGYQRDRHLFLLPAVMLAAWVGGLGPGCVATFLCTVALTLLWVSPGARAFPPVVTADVILFLLIGLAVSSVIDSLRIARAHADAARAARDQLLAIVVHDLGNPLNVIKLAAVGLRRTEAVDEAALRAADRIERAATRMGRLVHDLQDATQIERGTLSVDSAPELVGPILREVVEEFLPPSQAKGVHLGTLLPAVDTVVRADRSRLVQVLGNLVGNALKFTPTGGRIDLGAEERGDVVVFQVKDTGPGIEPEHLPHVFDRYWKANGAGTGLGLFIARGLVQAHGGRLDVSSRPGLGAIFAFEVPRGATQEPRAAVETRGPRLSAGVS